MIRLPSSFARSIVAILGTGLLLSACASAGPPPFLTVAGPESGNILLGPNGRFTATDATRPCYPLRTVDPMQRPHCVSRPLVAPGFDSAVLPERADTVLRMRTVVAGPTAADATLPATIELERLVECPGGQKRCEDNVETIATWSRPFGGDPYHMPLAISPDGARVATVPVSRLMKGPGYSGRIPSDARFRGLRYVGELMLVDLRTHAVHDAGIEVVADQPISWSADGKRLLIVRAEAIETLPAAFADGVVGAIGHPGQGVPVVEELIVDGAVVDRGAITMLAVGLQPLRSPDDRTLLYQPAHDRLATLDLATRVQRDVVLPGMSTRYQAIAIGFVAPRKVLYWALPTDGFEPDFSTRNSPLVGSKQLLSLKVADLDSGAFATVFPSLDPRARVGYRPA